MCIGIRHTDDRRIKLIEALFHDDGGQLSAHREFFGLPSGERSLTAARRPQCTITELAYIEDALADGAYFLSLQFAALGGDAIPSRPLLYPVRQA